MERANGGGFVDVRNGNKGRVTDGTVLNELWMGGGKYKDMRFLAALLLFRDLCVRDGRSQTLQ